MLAIQALKRNLADVRVQKRQTPRVLQPTQNGSLLKNDHGRLEHSERQNLSHPRNRCQPRDQQKGFLPESVGALQKISL